MSLPLSICHSGLLTRLSGDRRSEVKEEAGRSPAGGHERSRSPGSLVTPHSKQRNH